MNLLVLSCAGGKRRGALLRDGKLYRYLEDGAEGPRSEEIYLARTDRNMPGMEAVFVRLRKGLNAFLPYREIQGIPIPPPGGTPVLVQVKKVPGGQKQAFVSTQISLAGKTCILLPVNPRVTVSSRYPEEEKAQALRRARGLCPPGMGMILRLEGREADDETVLRERDALLARWTALKEKAAHAAAPCLLEGELPLEERLLRDARHGVDRAVADDPAAFALPEGLDVETTPFPMDLWNVPSQLKKSLERRIWLKSGANIVIDPCEALTVIDVNSAGDTGRHKNAEDSRLRVNEEAALEIARILQVRNTGGIILIDFIDMEKPESREQLTRTFSEALKSDPVKTVIHGFTALGLLEMTRKKTETPFDKEPDP